MVEELLIRNSGFLVMAVKLQGRESCQSRRPPSRTKFSGRKLDLALWLSEKSSRCSVRPTCSSLGCPSSVWPERLLGSSLLRSASPATVSKPYRKLLSASSAVSSRTPISAHSMPSVSLSCLKTCNSLAESEATVRIIAKVSNDDGPLMN